MATRNLTKQFKALRDGYTRRNGNSTATQPTRFVSRRGAAAATNARVEPTLDDATVRLVDDVDLNDVPRPQTETLAPALPPKWVDEVFDVEKTIKDVDSKLIKLTDLYQNHLLMRFDEEERQREGDAAETLAREITKKLKYAEGKIKHIGSSADSDADAKVRLNVQRTLATRVQNQSLELRKAQKSHMTQISNQQNAGNTVFVDDPLEAGYMDISRADMATLEASHEMVQARSAEIDRLAKNIEELATLFKNLAVLVIDQGTILDRIDANMDLVVERTQKGVDELDKANSYSQSNWFFYCMTILVVTILVLLGVETAKLSK